MSEALAVHRGHVDLAREATAAGLVVTQLMPLVCRCGRQKIEYVIQLWCADGRLWAEGSHETGEQVRDHIRGYAERKAGQA